MTDRAGAGSMTDELAFLDGTATTAPAYTGAEGRTCARHRWTFDGSARRCARCGREWDAAKARAGKRNRRHGNDMEREVARTLRGKRVGQLGTLVDVEAGPFLVQVKVGARFPGWIADILDGMPQGMTTRRVLAVFDSPGPGKARRGLVCELWGDWADENRGEA